MKKAKAIMIQGTMSSAGKSLLAAGLCRVFRQDGFRVAPFKAQNMALNSFITKEGLEMGRAQVMQAEAAGIEPSVLMNPILLKPTNDVGSQVIVNGEVLGNMDAKEYFRYKKKLIPDVQRAFHTLSENNDIIVIEGAGSPAEINLRDGDCFVNMDMAKMADAPVLLVGDIDRGGVFAQLVGTISLLEESERDRIKGLIINKFRGDKTILDPGIDMLEERVHIPVIGTVPYMDIKVDDEDSLTERFETHTGHASLDLAVIRFPRISNFTDFSVFEEAEDVSLRYVTRVSELGRPDLIFLPGSKDTIGDLRWMRQNGLEAAVLKQASAGTILIGICGGYQMLGRTISDPEGVEEEGTVRGMGLLPVDTVFSGKKIRTQVHGRFDCASGPLSALSGKAFTGYEIHMGRSMPYGVEGHTFTAVTDCLQAPADAQDAEAESASRLNIPAEKRNTGLYSGNVFGTYIHGVFDEGSAASDLLDALAARKGIVRTGGGQQDYRSFRESQYDILADTLRKSMNIDAIYDMMGFSSASGSPEKKESGNRPVRISGTDIIIENVKPADIEKRSFSIIAQELEQNGMVTDPETDPIVRRCIHTSADFDYAKNLRFSDGVVPKALEAIRSGACIVTDTQMARSGINKRVLARYGGEVFCFMSDEDVAREARARQVTRAIVSMEKAASLKRDLIFAIGNAPTALIHLYELIQAGKVRPKLVIGVPVGFVNVVPSKELIMQTDVPYIVAAGRKGGSNIAACICNALLYMLGR